MAEHQSVEQGLEQHIRDMGTDLGTLYNVLTNEVAWVHAKWAQYQQLYTRSSEQITLLNEVARHFFGIIQDTLLEDIILHLARLIDPPQSVGKDNLTLCRLPALIANAQLATEVTDLVKATQSACESARVWRNRRLAHRDLGLVLATATEPLPAISYATINAALTAMAAVLNCLEGHYWDSDTDYEHVLTEGGEADSMVYYLSEGIRAEEQRLERLRQGKPLAEDIAPRKQV
jgi:AbiU2